MLTVELPQSILRPVRDLYKMWRLVRDVYKSVLGYNVFVLQHHALRSAKIFIYVLMLDVI